MIHPNVQSDLFTHNIDKSGCSLHQASFLFGEGLLSFDPEKKKELQGFEIEELMFLVRLYFDSGLPAEVTKAMLKKLPMPYSYTFRKIYWDYGTQDWKELPQDLDDYIGGDLKEIFFDKFDDFLEEVDMDDEEELVRIKAAGGARLEEVRNGRDPESENGFAYDFSPEDERMHVVGMPNVESSQRNDVMTPCHEMRRSALQGLKIIRKKYPEKYTSGLHIYMGEYNDHLWLGFSYPGQTLLDIFLGQLQTNLPDEEFVIEETESGIISMIYTYTPSKILAFGTDERNGATAPDNEFGTSLEITPAELYPEDMRQLLLNS